MPSRRDSIVMTPDEIRTYLHSQLRLMLVTNGPNGYPHPMPMNFVFDDEDRILMTTFKKSQKVRNLQRNPKASLLVESGIAYGELKSVLAYAKTEIISDTEDVLRTMSLLMERESHFTKKRIETVKDQARSTVSKRVVLRFTADSYISWDHTKLGGRY